MTQKSQHSITMAERTAQAANLDDKQCSCGHRYLLEASKDNNEKDGASLTAQTTSKPSSSLDASFVHLPPSSLVKEDSPKVARSQCRSISKVSNGFLDRFKHLSCLEKTAKQPLDPPRLCLECVQRVERCLLEDTNRLDQESLVYEQAVKEAEERAQSWKRAFEVAEATAGTNIDNCDEGDHRVYNVVASQEEFQTEIERLKEACRMQEKEIRHLLTLKKEQAFVVKELDKLELAFQEERNALELEARAFDYDQEQLSRNLALIHSEVERLSSQIHLPSALFNLQVDKERGLRYPLINDLRLAYRPKGDVQWGEIQSAWSLAAQLLLSIGTLFRFQSLNWKIIPLSHCAKLIYQPTEGVSEFDMRQQTKKAVVFNLGHPKTDCSRALLAWNALLYQVTRHTTIKLHEATDAGVIDVNLPPLPYEIATAKIDNVALASLKSDDDAGWSKAIHCMASNLLWLSDCASTFLLQKVLLTAERPVGDECVK